MSLDEGEVSCNITFEPTRELLDRLAHPLIGSKVAFIMPDGQEYEGEIVSVETDPAKEFGFQIQIQEKGSRL